MAKFTGGVASYLRRINTGNYEHKEFKAEISWVAEPEDSQLTAEEWLERAADTAIAVVHQRLGLTERPVENHTPPVETPVPPAPPVENHTPPVENPVPPALPVEEPVAAHNLDAETKRITRRTKAELAAGVSLEEAAQRRAAEATKAATPKPPVEPLIVVDNGDPLLDMDEDEDELTALPPAIDDGELKAAAERKVHELQDAVKIRQLIGKYAQQMSMIPQERRRAFLDELVALTKE